VAVLAVWTATSLPQLLSTEPAGGTVARAAGADVGLSGLGIGGLAGPAPSSAISNSAAARLAAADGRVSRDSRGAALTGRAAGTPSRVPASAAVKPAGAVKPAAPLARWARPSAGGESSCFCMRWGVMHEGIDLAGPLGSPIVAVGDGVVTEAGPAVGFGLWVAIRHDNGDYSIYGHMYHYYVHVGQRVRAGQHIADIGANGRSTGPHLHFGIARGSATGPFLDPVPWLKARGVDIGPYNPDA
jgi:murein DD-endopeptidase MepM/ murein hydrolase activator NlpD